MNRVASVASNWSIQIQGRKPPKDKQNRQVWVWDNISKTIKSAHEVKNGQMTKSMDFRGGNAYAYTTDSRWY